MLDTQSQVLYVGKARNLKARVSNYARPSGHSGRIARMISETATMMFLTTRTETEALLLEQNLIKQLKPRYNVLLRDDKSFPNILIPTDHAFPMIKKHRGKKSEKGTYFGPFASAGAVNRTLNQLQRVFLLRTCTDATFDAEVLKSDKPVLVDFWAPWCGPCIQLGPVIDQVADATVGKAKVAKVNVDDCQQVASKYRINSIPALLLFKGGEFREQLINDAA